MLKRERERDVRPVGMADDMCRADAERLHERRKVIDVHLHRVRLRAPWDLVRRVEPPAERHYAEGGRERLERPLKRLVASQTAVDENDWLSRTLQDVVKRCAVDF